MEPLRSMSRRAIQQLSHTHAHSRQLNNARLHGSSNSLLPSTRSIVQRRTLHLSRPRILQGEQNLCRSVRHRARRFATTAPPQPQQSLSLSERLRKLSREYGWSAVGVYLFLSALDFPFCFAAVRMLGTDRVGHWEHVIVSKVKEFITWPMSEGAQDTVDGAVDQVKDTVKQGIAEADKMTGGQRLLEEGAMTEDEYAVVDHGYKEAAAANAGANASLWTQLALAYAIHKSFIFIRVPLTAAVTPKVVKTLRSWGWNIGKRSSKKAAVPSATGVNTKGTGVKND